MSPNKSSSNLSNLPLDIVNSYIVHVGEQTFRLYRSSITYDAPNFFTQAFFGEEATSSNEDAGTSKINNAVTPVASIVSKPVRAEENSDSTGVVPSVELVTTETKTETSPSPNTSVSTQNNTTKKSLPKEITIDRDPRLFEVILRYLRGYTIFPLSSVNLPPGMSLDLFRESLLEDARFYGFCRLAQLLQAETPTPLRYKDPFTSQDKILLSLRDVPIHKDFIKSKLEGPSAIEFFTGVAVLTLELDTVEATIQFDTEFLNEQDQKALQTLSEICGENTSIQLSRLLTTGWEMRETLNGIRLEIDGVQVTGVDIASLVGADNQKVKALEDMFKLAGGQKLVIYAQEFVFRLEWRPATSSVADSDYNNDGSSSQINGNAPSTESVDEEDEATNSINRSGENNDGSSDTIDESNASKNVHLDSGDDNNHPVYLGVVWAKGWTQDWWAWNEYRMKLDTLQ